MMKFMSSSLKSFSDLMWSPTAGGQCPWVKRGREGRSGMGWYRGWTAEITQLWLMMLMMTKSG